MILTLDLRPLVETLAAEDASTVFKLEKELGETTVPGIETPAWSWPKR